MKHLVTTAASRLGALACAALAWAACADVNYRNGDSSASDECPVGTEGCACTTGGACDPDLFCRSNTCQRPDGAGGGGAEGGEGGGGGAEGGEGGTTAAVFDEDDYGDLADCHQGCGHAHVDSPFVVNITATEGETGFSVNGQQYQTLRGTIDDDEHYGVWGYDLDALQVKIRPATLLEITVDLAEGSDMDPFVSTYDPLLIHSAPLYGWLTQNDDGSAQSRSARTVIAAPVLDEQTWLVVVDDARNLAGETSRGGESYRYELSFRVLGEVEYFDLDLSGDDRSDTRLEMELEKAGDIHYYRFVDPGHRRYLVEFESHHDDFCGHLWQIDLLEGAAWLPVGANDDDPSDGCTASLSFETASRYYDPDNDMYVFVVTDYEGRGSNLGLGAFTYDLTVRPAPGP